MSLNFVSNSINIFSKVQNIKLSEVKDVCKNIKKTFPYFSPTKFCCENRTKVMENNTLRKALCSIQNKIEENRNSRLAFFNNPIRYYQDLIKGVRKIKAMNCGEASSLTYLSLKLKGIKNCIEVYPKTASGRCIEHSLVKITCDDENILVDTWLGVVGTEKEIKQLYSSKYCDYFDLVNGEKIAFEPLKAVYIEDKNIESIKEIAKELFNA